MSWDAQESATAIRRCKKCQIAVIFGANSANFAAASCANADEPNDDEATSADKRSA